MATFTHVTTIVGGGLTHLSGISDLEIYDTGTQIVLYSASFADGGMNVFSLAEGQAAQFINSVGYGPNKGTLGLSGLTAISVDNQNIVIPFGQYDDALVLHSLGAAGAFTGIQSLDNHPDEIRNIEHGTSVVAGNKTFLFTSQMGQSGFNVLRINDDLSLQFWSHFGDSDTTYTADISAVDSVTVGRKSFFIAASAQDAGVTAFRVKPNGEILEKGSFSPSDGPGFSYPSVVTNVVANGKTFVVLGSAGTGTITVLRVDGQGRLKFADHVADTLATRFAGVAALEIFEFNDRWFLLAGGSDDGISLFEISPSGGLFLITSIGDQTQTTLSNVTAIDAAVFGSGVQVFVSGESEIGITQFLLDLGHLGEVFEGDNRANIIYGGTFDDLILGNGGRDTLYGGAGNDRLLDGKGKDHLSGGEGADIFVFEQDNKTDFIDDFGLGEDKIDMSDYEMLYHFEALTIKIKDYGALIKFAGERIKIYSQDGQPIEISAFTQDDFIF